MECLCRQGAGPRAFPQGLDKPPVRPDLAEWRHVVLRGNAEKTVLQVVVDSQDHRKIVLPSSQLPVGLYVRVPRHADVDVGGDDGMDFRRVQFLRGQLAFRLLDETGQFFRIGVVGLACMDTQAPLLPGKGRKERVHFPPKGFTVQKKSPVEAAEEVFDVRKRDQASPAAVHEFPLDVPDLVPAIEHLQKRQRARIDGKALVAQVVGVLEDDHPAALDEGHDHLDVRSQGGFFKHGNSRGPT